MIGLFCLWQNNDLSDSYFTITHKKIDENLAGFKIVQISDLHNKQFGKNQERLLKQIQEYNPDMIVVTGDLVDDNRTDIEAAMEFICGAVTMADVYYVTGNHELWFFPEYDAGLYSENETDMIVSRGLGNSVIPLRLFNRPEIVYVELETVQ